MTPPGMSRRQMLKLSVSIAGAATLTPLVNACTSSAASRPSALSPVQPNLSDVVRGSQQVQLAIAQSVNASGVDLFTFGLLLKSGEFIEGGSPNVWLSRGRSTPAIGPYPATWRSLTAYPKSGDHSPVTDLPGFYAATIQAPTAGTWLAAAVADSGQARAAGISTITVTATPPARVGTRALATPTPVATTPAGLAAVCTRQPPDPMHYVSLDVALRAHQPIVVCFATPLLCESRMCAPVLDEVLAVYRATGDRTAFIHVEEFPQRDESKPAPAFTAWGFQTEPWTVVIDKQGVIRAHFEGPVTAAQITGALQPLL